MGASFDVTSSEMKLIRKIVDRAVDAGHQLDFPVDRMSLEMDLTAVHATDTPLRLAELLAADEFHFVHDVCGIAKHLDRRTGLLKDHFLPRYARPVQHE